MKSRERAFWIFNEFGKNLTRLRKILVPSFESQYSREIQIEVGMKKFEKTYESMWKCLKEIILEEGIETTSPLGCFKEAFNQGLIDKQHEEIFPLMVKKRNEIVHIYSDEEAYEIYLLIKNSFAGAMVDVFEKVRGKMSRK